MAKRSRKVSPKRSKRPRRSKSSSHKTMKRTKRTKRQPSRKRTSTKPKKVKRKSVRKRKRTINDIKKGGGGKIKAISGMLVNDSIDVNGLITPKHLIKLNFHCNDDATNETKPHLRGKYFLYPILMHSDTHYPELLEKKCIPEIPEILRSDTNVYGLFYIKPNTTDPNTFPENKVICISKKNKYIKLISPGAPGAPDAPVVEDLNTQKLNFLDQIVGVGNLIKNESPEITELEKLMNMYQDDISTGIDAHPIDEFLQDT